jgi:hypothetical protein
MASVVFYLLVVVFVGWAAYKQGFSKGWADGYANGQQAGIKQGKEDGIKAGLKAGIKEHMISTLAETPEVPGIHADLHKQAREELLKVLNAPPPAKPAAPPKKVGLLRSLWQNYDGWVVLTGFVLLLVYLFRSG